MKEYLNNAYKVEAIFYVYKKTYTDKEILKAFKNLLLAEEFKKEMEKALKVELYIGNVLLIG